MRVTIPELGFELRPYERGSGWQLYEYVRERRNRTGEPLPDAWLPVECYPSSLEHGLRLVAERAARRSQGTLPLRKALRELRVIQELIVAAVERAVADEPGRE